MKLKKDALDSTVWIIIGGKTEGTIQMRGRRGRRLRQLPYDLDERRGY